jgi:Zn-dependent metalloprotease
MKKPVLASALAISCLSAAAFASAGGSQAAAHQTLSERRATAVVDARTNAAHHAGVTAGQGLVVRDTTLDRSGASHVRFERTYHGLEVVGGDLVIHQSQSGAFSSFSGKRLGTLSLSSSPALSGKQAAAAAGRTVDFAKASASPELVVLAAGRQPVLSWRVNVEGRNADGSPAGEYVFVNARSGKVVDHWPSVLEETGSGTGLFSGTVPLTTTLSGGQYTMVDATRGGNATYNGPFSGSNSIFSDADNVWGNGSTTSVQSAGVDAHYGIAETWDFYKFTYGRNGIANDGQGARSFVHDGAYVNASWNDSCFCMKYGDGDATTYYPLVELDVAGHEMSHGVTSRTANLTYRGESGGLNEANSDIFGTMVEWYANNANDVPDYVIGEEIFRNYNPATNYIRRQDKPSMDGSSADCWSKSVGHLNVHYSSGPANHYFYLVSEGSGAKTINGIAYNSPTCNGSTVTGIGHDKAAAIWYRALTVYMTSNTGYAGARVANVNAATDLYGATSPEVAAVKAAFSAINVN